MVSQDKRLIISMIFMIRMQLTSVTRKFVNNLNDLCLFFFEISVFVLFYLKVTSGLMSFNDDEFTRELVRDPF